LRGGHHIRLLQGSVEFFPALIADIDAARHDVWMETYIFDLTGTGADVAAALERAAARGVTVRVVVDGFGSDPLPVAWVQRFQQAGVQWRVYAPIGRLGLLLPGQWRRLHRKLCLVDGAVAYCGGINILDDFHDPNHGRLDAPRFDFTVRATGELAGEVRATMDQLWLRLQAKRQLRQARVAGAVRSLQAAGVGDPSAGDTAPAAGAGARAALVLRDNLRNRARIERAYLRAIGRAQHEVIIANAYFVPGRKMRVALVRAARRGVRVQLLLQGRYEYFMQYYAARPIYGALLRAGVEIHEYSPSFLHAKVAAVDGHWATVGSSNLDPLSLLLAREANVVVDNPGFAAALRDRLVDAMVRGGRRMEPAEYEHRPWPQRLRERLALVVMRLALAVQGKRYL